MHLFGTSGIRGIVGKDITPELFGEIAKALASTLPFTWPSAEAKTQTDLAIWPNPSL